MKKYFLPLCFFIASISTSYAQNAAIPTTPDLNNADDSGHSGSDNITNDATLSFNTCASLSIDTTLRLVRVPHGNAVGTGAVVIGSTERVLNGQNSNCTIGGANGRIATFSNRNIPEGDWDVYVQAIGQGQGWASDAVASGTLRVRVDRTAPTFVKATRVSDNAIDYYLTEGLRALRPANFNETLGATFTFDPTLAGSNILTATSTATERDANFFRINFSEAYATIASGVGKEISIDYATGSFNSLRAALTDEAGNELVDHSGSAVNYLPEIEGITLDQSGSHTITVSDPNAGDILSTEWKYVDATTDCDADGYGDSAGTTVTLTGSDNTARTGPVTYDRSTNADDYVCVKAGDGTDVAYAVSTNAIEEITGPIISIDAISDGYVNDADDENAVTISGTSANINDSETITLAITDSGSGSVTKTPTVTTNAWETTLTSAEMKGLAEGIITVTASYTDATDVTQTFIYDATVPVLADDIDDQTAIVETDFSFQIPTGTFTDANALTYTSSGESNGITFTTDTWSAVGADLTAGTVTITVTATDAAGNTATDEFDIVINSTPTDLTLSNHTVAENITTVGTFSTTDDVGDTHSYSLVAGTGDEDNGKFTITNNAIAFNSAPNFESPTDLGDTAGDNTYAIRVKTVDQDNEEYIKEFIITVTDVVEVVNFTIDAIADVSISEGVVYTSVAPSLSGGTPIGTVTYASSGDVPIGSVTDIGTGVISFPSLDYESPTDADTSNDYEVTITATDEDGNTATQNWTLNITDYLELGGVAINPLLWVKADEGLTEASSVITGWTDRSPSSEVATVAGSPVLSTSLINFNPSVLFDGTNDYFEFSKANIIKRRDNFTFIAVAGTNNISSTAHQHLLGTDQTGGVRITFRAGNIALHRSNVGDAILDPDPPVAQGDIGIVAISRSNESDFATYQDGAEFTKTDTRTTLSYETNATKTYIGRRTGNSERLNGQIAELVVFEDVLSAADLDKVQTHLAIKYGITLDSDVANYVNAAGTSVFDNSGTYVNDIVGIAKDDTSVLDQRISKSKNSGAILTISTDATFTGVNSGHTGSLTDGQYLIIGNDGGATTTQATETPGSTTNRVTREWKVENTGTVGSVNLKFDGLDDTYTLHTDADGDFSAGATEVGALNSDGEIAATLTDGIYFTLSTTTSPNTAPTDITLTLTNTTVDENQTVVGTFSTADDVGDTHTYSLVAGTGDEDNAKFTITNNAIAFNSAPNHESPTDAGDTANNNTYAIRVKTVDQDSEEHTKEFIITVTDVDENDANLTDLVVTGATVTPAFAVDTITYAGTVDNTVTSVTVTPTRSHPDATITIGGTAATSGSATTVTLSNGANAIAVVVTAEDTSETKTYTINITKTSTATIAISEVSDGYVNDEDDESAVTISGTSVNITAAQTIDLTFSDSNITATTAPVVAGTGGAADTWTTTIPSSEIKAAAEGTITVTAAYTGATPATTTFVYDATAPATPTLALANDTGSSNSDGITSDATVNVTGLETNATWEWTEDGTDDVVDGSGTSFELRSNEGAYNYMVTQTDLAGNSTSSIAYRYDHDANAPILANAISDKTATVGTQFTYAIPTSTFTEFGSPPLTYTSSGEGAGITFATNTWSGNPNNAETLSITLTATDVAGNTQTDEFDIVISAAPVVNNAPTGITLSSNSVAENTTAVGGLSTTDADVGDTHTYTLVSGQGGDDNGKFTLTTGGVLSFTTAPDFENPTDTGGADGDNGYGIRVQTEDQGGGTWTAIFTITVTDVAENDVNLSALEVAGVTISPAFNPAIVAYTSNVASTVATVSVTPTVSHPDATVTVGGVAATSGSASTVALSDGSNAISIVVRAENRVTTKTYTLNISRGAATNTPPSDIAFTDNPTQTIPENTTRVGAFEAVDPDVSDVHIFTIVTSGFGPDGDKFTLTPEGVLSFKTAPDFENPTDTGANNSYSAVIQVDDQNGGTFSLGFQIAVTNVVEDDATLSSIGITGATLAETFDPDTTTYSATVLNSVTSVTLNPTPSSSAAAATVNGAVPPSMVTLSSGLNAITVVVTAEDGTTQKTYTLNITRGTTPTIIINEVSGGYVNNAEDESAVTISGTSANIADSQTIDLTFSDSAITATTASVSGNTWSTTIPSAEIKAATEGTITVTASYTGATNATQTFVYDRTAPAAPTLSVIETGIGSITNNPTITVAGLEANATWEYRIEFSGWTAGTGTTFNATEGTADTHVRQTDQAGNVSSEGAIFSLLYDGTLPVLAMEIPDQTATVGTDFSFEIPPGTFTDANQIGYSSSGESNGITFATDTWSAVGADLTAGTVTITVTATDAAGNTQTDEFDIVIAAPLTTWTGTTDSTWTTATNWTDGVPTPAHNVSIPKTTNQPTATAAVTVNKVTMAAGASLMANDAFTGDITYNREISHVNGNEEGWYLMASPVVGQTYDATYVTTNGIALSSSNLGIGTHNTSTNDWTYLQSTGSGTFVPGQGYAIKRAAAGTISFTGTLNVDDVDVVLATTGDRFNLLGNPYPSYLNSADFLANTAIDDTQTLWVWSHDPAGSGGRGTYNVKTSTNAFIVAPGQGFFVRANTGGGTFNFSEANQSHNTTDTFQKSQTTQVKLDISDGAIERYCEIYYSPETTAGFDVGYDGELFSGAPNPFAIYTHLVSDSQGENYQIQSLPYSDIENMVIPIGINAVSGREITITADVKNFPDGVHLYLEDKLENSVTQLSKNDAKYTVTLSDNLEGIGRFFLRASSSDLGDFSTSLENISVYTSSKNNLRIVGIQEGNVKLRAYNILGAQIIDTSFKGNGKNDVKIPNLAAGIYIVHLEMETGKVSKKIVVE